MRGELPRLPPILSRQNAQTSSQQRVHGGNVAGNDVTIESHSHGGGHGNKETCKMFVELVYVCALYIVGHTAETNHRNNMQAVSGALVALYSTWSLFTFFDACHADDFREAYYLKLSRFAAEKRGVANALLTLCEALPVIGIGSFAREFEPDAAPKVRFFFLSLMVKHKNL